MLPLFQTKLGIAMMTPNVLNYLDVKHKCRTKRLEFIKKTDSKKKRNKRKHDKPVECCTQWLSKRNEPKEMAVTLERTWTMLQLILTQRLKTRSTAKPYIRATLPALWQATTKYLWQSSKKTRTHYPKKPQIPHPSAPGTKLRPNSWGSLRHCCLCIWMFSASSKDREGNCHWFWVKHNNTIRFDTFTSSSQCWAHRHYTNRATQCHTVQTAHHEWSYIQMWALRPW